MRPTMGDVAKAASVSTSTVSRALAGDPRVKEKTRRYIAAVAEELGYTPNRTAASLRRGKTWMIGVATPGTPRAFSDPFYLEFLGGLGDRAMEAGYNLVIAAPTPAGDADEISPDSFRRPRGLDLEGLMSRGAVDAVALTEPAVDDVRLEVLRRYRVPCAFLGTPEEGGRIPGDVSFVDGDNVGGSRAAVHHLISLGHTRIACLTGEGGLAATKQRLEGYLQALTAANLRVEQRWIVDGQSTKRGGRRAMEKLLGRGLVGDGPAAVFAGNDLMAVGALRAVKERGLRVPTDVSIVGFDGIPTAEMVEPALTTVQQPIYKFGRRLADVLLTQLGEATDGEKGDAQQLIVPGRLVVRGTTAPVPGD